MLFFNRGSSNDDNGNNGGGSRGGRGRRGEDSPFLGGSRRTGQVNCHQERRRRSSPTSPCFPFSSPNPGRVILLRFRPRTCEERNEWFSSLKENIHEQRDREKIKVAHVAVTFKDQHSLQNQNAPQQVKHIQVNNCQTSQDLLRLALSEFDQEDDPESTYQLWFHSGGVGSKDSSSGGSPYPLVGFESPFAITMAHLRNSLSSSSDGQELDDESLKRLVGPPVINSSQQSSQSYTNRPHFALRVRNAQAHLSNLSGGIPTNGSPILSNQGSPSGPPNESRESPPAHKSAHTRRKMMKGNRDGHGRSHSRSRYLLEKIRAKLTRQESLEMGGAGGGSGNHGPASGGLPHHPGALYESSDEAIPTGVLFSHPLSHTCPTPSTLPKPVYMLMKAIMTNGGLYTEQIFRKSAKQVALRELRSHMDSGEAVNFADCYPIVLASLLKEYLRSIPGKLLVESSYIKWVGLCDNQSPHSITMTKAKTYLRELPALNYLMLRHLMCLLHHVKERADVNMMTGKNLAVCIGPSLIHTPEHIKSVVSKHSYTVLPNIAQLIIENAVELFGADTLTLLGEPSERPSTSHPQRPELESECSTEALEERKKGLLSEDRTIEVTTKVDSTTEQNSHIQQFTSAEIEGDKVTTSTASGSSSLTSNIHNNISKDSGLSELNDDHQSSPSTIIPTPPPAADHPSIPSSSYHHGVSTKGNLEGQQRTPPEPIQTHPSSRSSRSSEHQQQRQQPMDDDHQSQHHRMNEQMNSLHSSTSLDGGSDESSTTKAEEVREAFKGREEVIGVSSSTPQSAVSILKKSGSSRKTSDTRPPTRHIISEQTNGTKLLPSVGAAGSGGRGGGGADDMIQQQYDSPAPHGDCSSSRSTRYHYHPAASLSSLTSISGMGSYLERSESGEHLMLYHQQQQQQQQQETIGGSRNFEFKSESAIDGSMGVKKEETKGKKGGAVGRRPLVRQEPAFQSTDDDTGSNSGGSNNGGSTFQFVHPQQSSNSSSNSIPSSLSSPPAFAASPPPPTTTAAAAQNNSQQHHSAIKAYQHHHQTSITNNFPTKLALLGSNRGSGGRRNRGDGGGVGGGEASSSGASSISSMDSSESLSAVAGCIKTTLNHSIGVPVSSDGSHFSDRRETSRKSCSEKNSRLFVTNGRDGHSHREGGRGGGKTTGSMRSGGSDMNEGGGTSSGINSENCSSTSSDETMTDDEEDAGGDDDNTPVVSREGSKAKEYETKAKRMFSQHHPHHQSSATSSLSSVSGSGSSSSGVAGKIRQQKKPDSGGSNMMKGGRVQSNNDIIVGGGIGGMHRKSSLPSYDEAMAAKLITTVSSAIDDREDKPTPRLSVGIERKLSGVERGYVRDRIRRYDRENLRRKTLGGDEFQDLRRQSLEMERARAGLAAAAAEMTSTGSSSAVRLSSSSSPHGGVSAAGGGRQTARYGGGVGGGGITRSGSVDKNHALLSSAESVPNGLHRKPSETSSSSSSRRRSSSKHRLGGGGSSSSSRLTTRDQQQFGGTGNIQNQQLQQETLHRHHFRESHHSQGSSCRPYDENSGFIANAGDSSSISESSSPSSPPPNNGLRPGPNNDIHSTTTIRAPEINWSVKNLSRKFVGCDEFGDQKTTSPLTFEDSEGGGDGGDGSNSKTYEGGLKVIHLTTTTTGRRNNSGRSKTKLSAGNNNKNNEGEHHDLISRTSSGGNPKPSSSSSSTVGFTKKTNSPQQQHHYCSNNGPSLGYKNRQPPSTATAESSSSSSASPSSQSFHHSYAVVVDNNYDQPRSTNAGREVPTIVAASSEVPTIVGGSSGSSTSSRSHLYGGTAAPSALMDEQYNIQQQYRTKEISSAAMIHHQTPRPYFAPYSSNPPAAADMMKGGDHWGDGVRASSSTSVLFSSKPRSSEPSSAHHHAVYPVLKPYAPPKSEPLSLLPPGGVVHHSESNSNNGIHSTTAAKLQPAKRRMSKDENESSSRELPDPGMVKALASTFENVASSSSSSSTSTSVAAIQPQKLLSSQSTTTTNNNNNNNNSNNAESYV